MNNHDNLLDSSRLVLVGAHERQEMRNTFALDRRWLSIELDHSFAALSSIRFLEGRSTNNIRETIEQIERSDAPQLKSGAKQSARFA
jgi:hypothetical protein